MKPLWWPGQRDSSVVGKRQNAQKGDGVQKLKQDEPPFPRATGPLLLHDIPTNYATNPGPALFAPLCIYARNQQPILGQLPSAVISSTGHPPRTPLPRHKCAPLCEPRRQFGKVFRQDAV